MTAEEKKKCHIIIHSTSTAAAAVGAGLAQIPGSDNAVLVPVQIGMVTALASVFGLTIDEAMAKGILATQLASMTGRTISQVAVGWWPVVGNVINSVTAAGITEGIGWTIARDFSNQKRKLESFNSGITQFSL